MWSEWSICPHKPALTRTDSSSTSQVQLRPLIQLLSELTVISSSCGAVTQGLELKLIKLNKHRRLHVCLKAPYSRKIKSLKNKYEDSCQFVMSP